MFAFDPEAVRSARSADELAQLVSSELLTRAENAAAEGRVAEARTLIAASVEADSSPSTAIWAANLIASLGNAEESEAILTSLLDTRATDPDLRRAVCHNLAALARDRGEALEAHRRQQQAASAALECPTDPGRASDGLDARDLIGLANDAIGRRDIATADSLLDAARRSARANQDLEALADVWGTRGAIALTEGRLETALHDLRTATRLHRACGDQKGLGIDLLNLAEALRLNGRPAAARSLARRAAARFRRAAALALERRALRAARDMGRLLAVRRGVPAWN